MDDRELDWYHERISLGERVKKILGSEVGLFICRKAREEVEAAIDEFLAVNPKDEEKIAAIQVRVKSALAVPQWLDHAVIDSDNAVTEYLQRKEIEKEEKEINYGR